MGLGANLTWMRGALKERLTPGERAFFYTWTAALVALPAAALACLFLGHGAVSGVGIALAFLTLVVWAVPISPILRARVQRREGRGA